MQNHLTLNAHAKVNLALKIVGRYQNGYHSLVSLLAPISLHDRVSIETIAEADLPTGQKFVSEFTETKRLELHRAAAEQHPVSALDPSKNTVNCLVSLLYEKNLLPPDRYFKISICKDIPTEAGLGGGSSDAAAVLNACIQFFDLMLSEQEKVSICSQIGSDVPALLNLVPQWIFSSGTVIKQINPHRKSQLWKELSKYKILLVKPPVGSNTASAYHDFSAKMPDLPTFSNSQVGLKPGLLEQEMVEEALSKLGLEARALEPSQGREKKNIYADPLSFLGNDFENVVYVTHPPIEKVRAELVRLGAIKTLLAGSGSTVLGFFPTHDHNVQAESNLTRAIFPSGSFISAVDFSCWAVAKR